MKRAFALRFLIDGLGRLAMMGLTVLLARALGVDPFGRFSFASSFAGMASIAADGGLLLIFLRELGRTPQDSGRSELWGEFFGLKLFLGGGVFLVAGLISFLIWPWPTEKHLPLLLLVWMAGNTLVDFFHQACNAAGRVSGSLPLMLWHRGLMVGGGLAAVSLSQSLTFVSAVLAVASWVGVWVAWRSLRGSLSFVSAPSWRPRAWAARLGESLPLAAGAFFGSLYLRFGILFLPWAGFSVDTGLFGAVYKLFEAGFMISAAFTALAVPRLSALLAAHPEAVPREINRMLVSIAVLGLVWWVGVGISSRSIVMILFGEAFLPAVSVLRLLAGINALASLNHVLTCSLVVLGLSRRHAVNEAVCLLAAGAVTWYLVLHHGMIGAAWSLAAVEVLLFCLTLQALLPALRLFRRIETSGPPLC